MLDDLCSNSKDLTEKTIVIDAGIATEENIELIKGRGMKYVCVSRKKINNHPVDTETKKAVKLTNRGNDHVELVLFDNQETQDTWMYVKSKRKQAKEESISKKLHDRFVQDMEQIKQGIEKKGGTKKTDKVHQRLGRIMEKNKRVSGQYEIEVEAKDGLAINLNWLKKENISKAKTDKEQGVYFIRTNLETNNESILWDIYLSLIHI